MRLDFDHSFVVGASEDRQGIAIGSMDPMDLVRGPKQSSVKSDTTADDAYTITTQYNETLLRLAYASSKGPRKYTSPPESCS